MRYLPLPAGSTRGNRMKLTALMVFVAVLDGVLKKWGMGMSDTVIMALFTLVGGAIAADTVRPSGMGKTEPAPPSAPISPAASQAARPAPAKSPAPRAAVPSGAPPLRMAVPPQPAFPPDPDTDEEVLIVADR